MKVALLLILLCCAMLPAMAQGIRIGSDNTPSDPSAILDINSTTKGILIPRMSMAERDAILDPADGLMVYVTDQIPGLYMHHGVAWNELTILPNVWSTDGNDNTDPSNNFIGTTDNMPLRFRVNNRWAGEFDTQSGNVCIGDSAGVNNSNGFANVGMGNRALQFNEDGFFNVAIGHEAMWQNTIGNNNVAIGHQSMRDIRIGTKNSAVGAHALSQNWEGHGNCAFGYQSLYSNFAGQENVAVGAYAGRDNVYGDNNVAIGYEAMTLNENGLDNTVVGNAALYYNDDGSYNTAIGRASLQLNQSNYNTAVGFKAGYGIITGDENTAIGASALENTGSGQDNTAVGSQALRYNTASYNTAVGALALWFNTSGDINTAIGTGALNQNTTGTYNTALGNYALSGNVTGNYNVGLGYGSNVSEPDMYNTVGISNTNIPHLADNQVIIGNTSMVAIGGPVPWSVVSDARIKLNVQEDVPGLAFISKLRPVTYNRSISLHEQMVGGTPMEDFPGKYDAESIRYSGFIAQEIDSVAAAIGYDFSGVIKPANSKCLYALSYETFVVPLVKAVQEQQTMIESQQQLLSAKEDIIQKQQAMIDALIEGYIDHEVRLTAVERQKTK